MKRTMALIMVLLLLLCACAPTQEAKSSVSGDEELFSQSSSAPEEQQLILEEWHNEDWQQKQGTCFAHDLDGDGAAEEFTYRMDEAEWEAFFTVGSQNFSFGYGYVEQMVLVDFDAQDAAYDLFICGDVASSDYVILQMRIDCSGAISLQQVGQMEGFLNIKGEEFWVEEVINALGTWIAVRQYGPDAQGLLHPLTDTLTLNQEGTFQEERWLTLRKDLQVSGGNGGETLPAGTKCYPICYAQDLSWADLKLEDGSVVRLQLQLKRYEDDVFSDYEWEEMYFENLRYAG